MQLYRNMELKINEYMGTGAVVMFFACLLLFWLLKKEKSRQMKVYLFYALFVVIGMTNPLSLYVIEKSGNMNVYERFFWLLMIPVFVSFSFAVFVQERKKLLIPCLLLLVLGGNIVFTDIEYSKAENAEKISQEAIDVSDMIMRDFEGLDENEPVQPNRMLEESPCAVVPEPIVKEIRMYNADIRLWFVRKDFGSFNKKGYRKLAALMIEENSEVPADTLFRSMRSKGFTYFVLGDWQELTGDTGHYAYEQIGQTENYRVYKYTKKPTYTLTQFADVEGFSCMSYMIEKSDGGLVVIDGGRAWQSLSMLDEIKKRGGVVDAWIITHPHDDHCGVLCSILAAELDRPTEESDSGQDDGTDMPHITIRQIYIGEMDFDAAKAQSSRADTYGYLLQGLEGHDNYRFLKEGDELDVIGLRMQVLHTCNEAVLENSENLMNDGSMVFKLSGEKKSILFLGDIGDNNPEIAASVSDRSEGSEMGRMIADEILAAYPDDIKADYVQMSHHGNNAMPDYFYEAISPSVAFFDAPDWLMENKNKDTGETSYYSTPHYRKLMERLGARIISYSSKERSVTFR